MERIEPVTRLHRSSPHHVPAFHLTRGQSANKVSRTTFGRGCQGSAPNQIGPNAWTPDRRRLPRETATSVSPATLQPGGGPGHGLVGSETPTVDVVSREPEHVRR